MGWLLEGGVILLLMMLFCKQGEAVECYICSTKFNETHCLYPKSYGLPRIQCDQNALEKTRYLAREIDFSYDKIFEVDTRAMAKHIDLNCLKVVTKLGNKLFTFRGCQLAEQENLDICSKIKKVDTEFLIKQHCSRCSVDGCNSATKLLWQNWSYLLLLVMSVFMYRSFY